MDQYYYGRLGWLPSLEKGAAHETFDSISMDDCYSFQPSLEMFGDDDGDLDD